MAKCVANEALVAKIKGCQTFAELASLESQCCECERGIVFEKKLELIGRVLEEETQDECLANSTGPWRLDQRQQFEMEWQELVDAWR